MCTGKRIDELGSSGISRLYRPPKRQSDSAQALATLCWPKVGPCFFGAVLDGFGGYQWQGPRSCGEAAARHFPQILAVGPNALSWQAEPGMCSSRGGRGSDDRAVRQRSLRCQPQAGEVRGLLLTNQWGKGMGGTLGTWGSTFLNRGVAWTPPQADISMALSVAKPSKLSRVWRGLAGYGTVQVLGSAFEGLGCCTWKGKGEGKAVERKRKEKERERKWKGKGRKRGRKERKR